MVSIAVEAVRVPGHLQGDMGELGGGRGGRDGRGWCWRPPWVNAEGSEKALCCCARYQLSRRRLRGPASWASCRPRSELRSSEHWT